MAIAYDTSADLGFSFAGSKTTAFTCTGTNRILFVGGWGGSGSSNWTGVTYAGVAMTKVGEAQVPGDRWVYLYILANPASGSNNVVITESGTDGIDAFATSYTGAQQTSTPDASNTVAGTTTNTALSVTTTADNCWGVAAFKYLSAAGTAGANTILRVTTANGSQAYDSNSALTPAGTLTLNVTHSSTAKAMVMCSFGPALSVYTLVADVGVFTLTGVSALIGRIISMIASTGTFILTGIDATFRRTGWSNPFSKNAISPSNVTKNSASPSNVSKTSSTWTNRGKNQ